MTQKFHYYLRELNKYNCVVIGAAIEQLQVLRNWSATTRERGGLGYVDIYIIADYKREISTNYGVLKMEEGVEISNEGLFIIDEKGIIRYYLDSYNKKRIARDIEEVVRKMYKADHAPPPPQDNRTEQEKRLEENIRAYNNRYSSKSKESKEYVYKKGKVYLKR